ncbi:condensation domain-containing protein, partial [Gemmatimonadota bacterium]
MPPLGERSGLSESDKQLQERLRALSPAKRALLERQLRRSGAPSGSEGITPRGTPDPCGLSFNQQRQWFLERLHPGSAAYNVWTSARLAGPLDLSALRRATNAVARRHETLRTRFVERDGEPLQVVDPEASLEVEVVDLSDRPGDVRGVEAEERANQEATAPLDLEKGVVARVTLYRLSEEDHVLLLVLNHIISDAWSRRIFMRDLGEAYSALVSETEPRWPPLP